MDNKPRYGISSRAKAYVIILTVRSFLFAVVGLLGAFLFPGFLFASSFVGLVGEGIGFFFGTVAIGGIVSIVKGSAQAARWTLLGSAVVSAMWFATLIITANLDTFVPIGYLIVLGAVIAKDLTMLSNPIRVPFEDLATKLARKDSYDRTSASLEGANRDLRGG